MELVRPAPGRPVVVFGEAMIELSGVDGLSCRLGVAGDTFNTAVYMARGGLPVTYMTGLGDEVFSQRIEAALAAEGVGTEMLARVPGGVPGLYAISVDPMGERSFTYWRSASAVRSFFATREAPALLDRAGQASLLYLSGITLSLFAEQAPGALVDLAKLVRQAGGHVAFDTNYRARGWTDAGAARAAVAALAPWVSVALPTFEDDAVLFGDASPEETWARWRRTGAEEVVVKHGAEGALIGAGAWIAPPLRLRPVDSTGAGDSFNAGYLAARLRGQPAAEAALAGHALAAKVVMVPGAIIPRGSGGS